MSNLRDFSQWLTNPNPATPTLRERMRNKKLGRQEAEIMTLARQIWEEDGKIWSRFESVENYYRSKALEKLNSQKKNYVFSFVNITKSI